MPLPNLRYPLDPTGNNPDNAVIGEIHNLSQAYPNRALAPSYGPFFTESVKVYDHNSNTKLTRNTHFVCVELLQEATLKYGKEIAQLILIIDPNISSEIRINYQTLGGDYSYNPSAIINLYETALQDNRDVDWVNVRNKPYEYPPTLHNHLLEDVYGFEYFVIALERIRNAIILTDVPEFEALIEWVKQRMKDTVSEAEIDAGFPVDKWMTYERFLYALDKHGFNAITLTPDVIGVNQGQSINFQMQSTNLPDNTVLYWTIEHINTTDADFNAVSGVVNVMRNKASFTVPVAIPTMYPENDEYFRIVLRRNSPTGPIISRSEKLYIFSYQPPTDDFMSYRLAESWFNPLIEINPFSTYFIREI